MRTLMLALLSFAGLALSHRVAAITCTSGDWDDFLCNLEEYRGTRCINAEFFRIYCDKNTDGCSKVGGCVGMTPPGHWYPIVDNGVPRWRCRCGCFAEETTFRASEPSSGRSLIEASTLPPLASLDHFDGASYTLRPINTFMHSVAQSAIRLVTEAGKVIELSEAHPVLMGNHAGELQQMKQAQAVKAGDYLINEDGGGERVATVAKVPYTGEMVNFNVASEEPAHHIVLANGLQLGDLGWQEELSAVGSRLLYRADIRTYLEARQARSQGAQP